MNSITPMKILFALLIIASSEAYEYQQKGSERAQIFQRLKERRNELAPNQKHTFDDSLVNFIFYSSSVKSKSHTTPESITKLTWKYPFYYAQEASSVDDSSSSAIKESSASSEDDDNQCGGTTTTTLRPSPQQEGKDECANGFEGPKMYFCNSTGSGFYNIDFQFIDPTPPNAVVNLAVFDFYGAFDCFDSNHTLNVVSGIVFLQDQHLNFDFPLKYGNCTNPYCTETPLRTTFKPPHYYNHNGLNLFRIVASVPICAARTELKLSWVATLPQIANVFPRNGPIAGETPVVVALGNFDKRINYTCLFDNIAVPAVQLTISGFLVCNSPPRSQLGNAEFKVLDDRFSHCIPDDVETFTYYDIRLKSLTPDRGLLSGGTDLSIALTSLVDESMMIVCLFESSNGENSIRVVGTILNKVVHCPTPSWPKEEAINLFVSFNGGVQFTDDSLSFEFYQVADELSDGWWLAIGIGLFALLLIALIVGFVVSRFTRAHKYRSLQEDSQEITMRDVKLLECIGKGTFGEVYRAQWRGAVIALKKLPLAKLKDGALEDFQKEITLMKGLRHPNILQYLGGCLTPPDIFIILEYMSRGSLYSILHNPEFQLSWGLVVHMLTEASHGCLYLHTLPSPIIHRDLKSHNLLVDESWRVKVADFGLSTHLDQHGTMTACGTPSWTAPEVIRHARYTEKADVYSFGIVMWECVTRSDPYAGLPPFKVIYAVGHQGMRPAVPQYVPASYATIMKKCWSEDPATRPSFNDIVERLESIGHDGFSSVSDVFTARITLVPALDDIIPAVPRTRKHRHGGGGGKDVAGSPVIKAGVGVTEGTLNIAGGGGNGGLRSRVAPAEPIAVSFVKHNEQMTASLEPAEEVSKLRRMPRQLYGTFVPQNSVVDMSDSTSDGSKTPKLFGQDNGVHDVDDSLDFAAAAFVSGIQRQEKRRAQASLRKKDGNDTQQEQGGNGLNDESTLIFGQQFSINGTSSVTGIK